MSSRETECSGDNTAQGEECDGFYQTYGDNDLKFEVMCGVYEIYDIHKYGGVVQVSIPADDKGKILSAYQRPVKFMNSILDPNWGIWDKESKTRFDTVTRTYSVYEKAQVWVKNKKRNLIKQLIEILSKKQNYINK